MATAPKREVAAATRAAGEEEGDGESGESDGDAYEVAGDKEGGARAARVMATPTKRAMAAATRAAGDEEGDVEGGESDGDGDKDGDSEKEGEGPHLSSLSDRLPPHHMLPLLLRLATAFRAVVAFTSP